MSAGRKPRPKVDPAYYREWRAKHPGYDKRDRGSRAEYQRKRRARLRKATRDRVQRGGAPD